MPKIYSITRTASPFLLCFSQMIWEKDKQDILSPKERRVGGHSADASMIGNEPHPSVNKQQDLQGVGERDYEEEWLGE